MCIAPTAPLIRFLETSRLRLRQLAAAEFFAIDREHWHAFQPLERQ
jgi:hypothetical protein